MTCLCPFFFFFNIYLFIYCTNLLLCGTWGLLLGHVGSVAGMVRRILAPTRDQTVSSVSKQADSCSTGPLGGPLLCVLDPAGIVLYWLSGMQLSKHAKGGAEGHDWA